MLVPEVTESPAGTPPDRRPAIIGLLLGGLALGLMALVRPSSLEVLLGLLGIACVAWAVRGSLVLRQIERTRARLTQRQE